MAQDKIEIIVEAKVQDALNKMNLLEKKPAQTKSAFGDMFKNMKAGYLAIAAAIAGAIAAAKKFVDAANEQNQVMRKLQAVSQYTGNSFLETRKAALALAADGLLSVKEASNSLANLLSKGLSLPQAITLINQLKDSSVVARQAQYGIGEAVEVATEGIRNENSILSDATGVTENLAKMYLKYARSIGTTTEKLTDQQKAQAVVEGFTRGTAAFIGQADKASKSFQGTQAKLASSTKILSAALGDQIINGLKPYAENMANIISSDAISNVKKGASVIIAVISTIVRAVQLNFENVGLFFDSIKNAVQGISAAFQALLKRDIKGAVAAVKGEIKEIGSATIDLAKSSAEDFKDIWTNVYDAFNEDTIARKELIEQALKYQIASEEELTKLTTEELAQRISEYEKAHKTIVEDTSAKQKELTDAEKQALKDRKKLMAEAIKYGLGTEQELTSLTNLEIENRIEMYKNFKESVKDMWSSLYDTLGTIVKGFFDTLAAYRDEDLEQSLDALEEEKDAKITALEESNEYTQALAEIEAQETADKIASLEEEIAAAKAANDEELASEKELELQKLVLKEQEAAKDAEIAAQTAAVEAEYAEKERQAKIDAANADKAWSITQSLIDTAVAVVKGIAEMPVPPFPLAIAAGAAGAAQTAIIAAQPIPAFAKGGVVPDDSLAMVNRKEMILPVELSDFIRSAAAGSSTTNNDNRNTTINFPNADPFEIIDIIEKQAGRKILSVQR